MCQNKLSLNLPTKNQQKKTSCHKQSNFTSCNYYEIFIYCSTSVTVNVILFKFFLILLLIQSNTIQHKWLLLQSSYQTSKAPKIRIIIAYEYVFCHTYTYLYKYLCFVAFACSQIYINGNQNKNKNRGG